MVLPNLFFVTLLAGGLTFITAQPQDRQQRISGGAEIGITTYPFSSSLLYSKDFINYQQECGATIVNNRNVITAAHCVIGDSPIRWRIRVGSASANSGGVVSSSSAIVIHPNYNVRTLDNDIAIVRSATIFVLNNNVRAANIAAHNYTIPENAIVWATGWGSTTDKGPRSATLRRVQIWTVNQAVCRSRYAELGHAITDNMLCAGWLDVGGRGQCAGDDGSALIQGSIVVGIRSWGQGCGLGRYPGVNTRITRVSAWITANV